MATHSSILARKIPWTEEPSRLQFMGSQRVRHDWAHTCTHAHSESEVAQSCRSLCDPMDCSLPRSSVHGILQARILELVAISFSKGFSRPRDQTRISCIVGRHFTVWATREVLHTQKHREKPGLALACEGGIWCCLQAESARIGLDHAQLVMEN